MISILKVLFLFHDEGGGGGCCSSSVALELMVCLILYLNYLYV